jgi:hypothetical protein
MDTFYSLSLEELAAVISLTGQRAQARALLINNLGDMSPDEERGRMFAADHSLMARDLVSIKDKKPQLHPDLVRIVNGMFGGGVVIRSGKTGAFGEDSLSYYFGFEGWLEHKVRDSVIFTFRLALQPVEVEKAICTFFSPVFTGWHNIPPVDLPGTLLVDLDPVSRRSFDKVLAFIKTVSPGNKAAEQLAIDFAQASWRGSIFWIYGSGNKDLSSKGTLFVQGPERLWLINSKIIKDQAIFQAELCSATQFQEKIHGFILTKPEP